MNRKAGATDLARRDGSDGVVATSPVHAGIESPDPLRYLDHASRLQAMATRKVGGGRIELFHRLTLRTRAVRAASEGPAALETGSEEGIAIRLAGVGSRSAAFAAASGGDERAVGWALERAAHDRAWAAREGGCEWAGGDGRLRLDLDPRGALPAPEALDRWLTGVLQDLPRGARGRVEAGVTIESLVNDRNLLAVRLRRRAWATFEGPRSSEAESEHVRTFVGEDIPELASAIAADASFPAYGNGPVKGGKTLPLVLVPEAASALIRALGQALHRERPDREILVGPGWRLREDPMAQGSPFSAIFDDVGFESRSVVLADGRQVTGWVEGPGHLRRPSFRDPPAPVALNLVVTSEPEPPPSKFLLVEDLRIHGAQEERWLLDLGLRGRASGERRFLGTRPEDLVQRVVATVGLGRPTAKGVITPGLVLEGLRLE